MVRLEKIIWEKAVNTKTLGRARQLGLPRKYYRYSTFDHNMWLAQVRQNSWLGKLLAPIQKAWGSFVLRFMFDKNIKMGLSWEDKMVHSQTDIRRDYFFEHIQRQNFHPYQWLLKSMRRGRFYKVQRTMPGFQVPDYIIDEASQSTFVDAVRLQKQYSDFVYAHYESDQTHVAHGTIVPKTIPLEYIIYNGLLRHESYDRYFYNEKYNLTHADEVNHAANGELSSQEKDKLRSELQELNSSIPSFYNSSSQFQHVEQGYKRDQLSH